MLPPIRHFHTFVSLLYLLYCNALTSHNVPTLSQDLLPHLWPFLSTPALWLCCSLMQLTCPLLSPGVASSLLVFLIPLFFFRLLDDFTVHFRCRSFQVSSISFYSSPTLMLSYRWLILSCLRISIKCKSHQMLLFTFIILWGFHPMFSTVSRFAGYQAPQMHHGQNQIQFPTYSHGLLLSVHPSIKAYPKLEREFLYNLSVSLNTDGTS